jgi:outer membrane protein
MQVALERNPTYLQQLNAVERAAHSERSSMGALLPSLSASVGFGGRTSRTLTAFDEFNQPRERPEFGIDTGSSASQGLNGGLTLFDLQQIRNWGAARAATVAQEAGVAYQGSVVRRQVGDAYYGAVQRARLLEVEERQLEMARENLEAIRRLLRVAAKQPTDVLGAELDLTQAELAVRQARGEAEKAMLSLREVMGVPMTTAFRLTDGFPEVFDPATLPPAALMERAARHNPELLREIRNVEAADRSLSAVRAARFPSLSGSYNYGRSASMSDYDAIGEFDLPNWSWGFGISVDIPLFNRFQTSAQIGQAEVGAENARESLRQTRLQLEREVLSARIDLDNAYAGVQVAERSVEIARERLAQGQELYRQGTLDYTALQQMINAVANAERGLVNARARFATALLALEEKLGGPVGG